MKECYFDDIDYGYYTNHIKQFENGDILTFGTTCYLEDNQYRYMFICSTIMRIKAEDLGLKTLGDNVFEVEKADIKI